MPNARPPPNGGSRCSRNFFVPLTLTSMPQYISHRARTLRLTRATVERMRRTAAKPVLYALNRQALDELYMRCLTISKHVQRGTLTIEGVQPHELYAACQEVWNLTVDVRLHIAAERTQRADYGEPIPFNA